MFNLKHVIKNSLAFVVLVSISVTSFAEEYLVSTPKAYKKALKKVQPGDEIVLANGTWSDFEILFKANGTEQKPITLKAETKGKVILSGQSNLRLAGEYLVVSGLVFKNGFTPSSAVIAYRQNKENLAFHSRVTEVVIDNYNNPDKQESDYWVALYGQHNRFDHNHLVGKRNKGVTVAVRLDHEKSQQNHHIIDFNYFGPRPVFGSNGGETLRIGTSKYSLSDSFTRVENNYFDRCNGEVEIISVKSGKNKLRNNVFFESRGTLTLRHGNGNIVEGNVFFGNGVDHTGGIRVINKNQVVRNNYMEGLTGYRFGSGFTVMNGVPNSPINRYHQVENARIENNSMINVDHIQLAAGSDKERSATPKSSTMNKNIIFNANKKQPFTVFDDISGIAFSDNIANTSAATIIAKGIEKTSIELTRLSNGLLYPVDENHASFGASQSLSPITKAQVGAHWYPKSPGVVEFSSGKTIEVSTDNGALFNAIEHAKDGDVLLLSSGNYDVKKIIYIDKTVTVKAKEKGKARITFQRTALFEILNGGSLKLDGLVLDGSNSPDSHGNSLIRTKKWGMIENYRFTMMHSVVENLNVNHSFHFFDSGKGAFADKISLICNQFINVTGDVLRLDKEIEDLGIYNAEYVELSENRFYDIEGALVKLYRGGTDESTFGPHLAMNNNKLKNVGNGKRNKSNASLYLHGVQVTNIDENTVADSSMIKVEHTVGEPKTSIKNNQLSQEASVVELRVSGPHTAHVMNNTIIGEGE